MATQGTIYKNNTVVKQLKRWLKKNNPCYLAWKLNYKSTQSIEHWIEREKIPHWMLENVIKVISVNEFIK